MSKPTALIADDVETMQQLLKKILESIGVKVIAEVANGELALQAIIDLKPDICFLDIDMPGRTGLEVLEEIRTRSITTYPVIVSGHSDINNIKAAIALGVKAFVVKPYSLDKIKHTVASYLVSIQGK